MPLWPVSAPALRPGLREHRYRTPYAWPQARAIGERRRARGEPFSPGAVFTAGGSRGARGTRANGVGSEMAREAQKGPGNGGGRADGEVTLGGGRRTDVASSGSLIDPNHPTVAKVDEVARDAVALHNPPSVQSDTEYLGIIFEGPEGISSTTGVLGAPCGGAAVCAGPSPYDALAFLPEGARPLAVWHTHGARTGFEYFSPADVWATNQLGARYPGFLGSYLGTPGGNLRFYPAGELPEPKFTLGRYVGRVPIR